MQIDCDLYLTVEVFLCRYGEMVDALVLETSEHSSSWFEPRYRYNVNVPVVELEYTPYLKCGGR